RRWLEFIYAALIERNSYVQNANEITDCELLLNDIPLFEVTPIQKRWSDYLSDNDVAVIEGYKLDILVRCGFRILRGNLLNAAKYGVWSFHHGDNRINRGGPAGFWETMENWPETGSVLQILTEDLDNGKVLCRSFSCTNDMSVADNRSNYYWKSLFLLPRKMKELYDSEEKEFFARLEAQNKNPEFYSERLYTPPSNLKLAKLVSKKIWKKTTRIIASKLWFDQWILMFHIKEEFSSALWRYKPIMPPKDRFWADPHVVYRDGRYYIFIEEYLYSTGKGHISLIVMDADGNYTEPELLIEKPYHLSYPSVFEFENNYYMIPESTSNRTIELYKCVEFPRKWKFHMNLMENVSAVDTTLIFHNDKWWMFTNVKEHESIANWDELFLFSSQDLFSKNWRPHPRNPVVSDCKTARPAGNLFYMNGSLYRPSQNCSRKYGYGFNISEITAFDETDYSESLVSQVQPNWSTRITGTHTFNRVESLHIIDALYRRRRF
ncbi:MAG: glucosamine inositolphosphorylceramide transferase family protein, partial [Gammaproteobacteria bacterium]